MKEHPILFTGEMVRAVLDGRKTQTRRTAGLASVNKDPGAWALVRRGALLGRYAATFEHRETGEHHTAFCPYGVAGDQLWGRETWNCIDTGRLTQRQDWVRYRATDGDELYWRPSIFMPRWASRIQLDLQSVRVERVQDISEADMRAEGLEFADAGEPVVGFQVLWDSINAKRGMGWAHNPWCWVLTFKQVQP